MVPKPWHQLRPSEEDAYVLTEYCSSCGSGPGVPCRDGDRLLKMGKMGKSYAQQFHRPIFHVSRLHRASVRYRQERNEAEEADALSRICPWCGKTFRTLALLAEHEEECE